MNDYQKAVLRNYRRHAIKNIRVIKTNIPKDKKYIVDDGKECAHRGRPDYEKEFWE